MNYEFNIIKDKIKGRCDIELYTGNIDTYNFIFDFDANWNNLKKFITFSKNSECYVVEIIDDKVSIPAEILDTSGICTFGIYATNLSDNIKRISTQTLDFNVSAGAYSEGLTPQTPTPDIWESLFKNSIPKIIDGYWHIFDISENKYVNTNIRAIGENGQDGNTPQCGIDYFTDSDKDKLLNELEKKAIGDIESAMDSIIEIQNELIGGDGI